MHFRHQQETEWKHYKYLIMQPSAKIFQLAAAPTHTSQKICNYAEADDTKTAETSSNKRRKL